jgi:protein-S-isoprenylcysteine O-methyltransferase Ste14
MAVNWLRAEAADIVRDKVVLPVQQLGMTLASAAAAAILLVVGLLFIFVAVLMLLAKWITWPGALGLVGGLTVLGAALFTYIKMRSIQK